ncbi:hypothetical protein HAX54_004672 [Datura stramonium]|uniref:Uncharacterized protein n=1 Tax=Datura stramonium TaxID=4076 RepID=A0ABS8WWY0_DATST|nr:hypothetical protein [Datura stramonium]
MRPEIMAGWQKGKERREMVRSGGQWFHGTVLVWWCCLAGINGGLFFPVAGDGELKKKRGEGRCGAAQWCDGEGEEDAGEE